MRRPLGLLLLAASAVLVISGQPLAPSRGSILVSLPGPGGAGATWAAGAAAPSPPAPVLPRPHRAYPGPKPRRAQPRVAVSAVMASSAQAATALVGVGPGAYALAGSPSISAAVIEGVLERYGSPMAGQGQLIYDLGRAYGIDPAFCLAFFVHESAAGTRGEAILTRSMGNIRARVGEPSRDGYRLYTTWGESVRDWYRLMRDVYIGRWHLRTVAEIVPVYAPSSDDNDVAAYISDVQTLVSDWRAVSGG